MIKTYRNFITDQECNQLMSFFKTNKELIFPILNDNLYHYFGINIVDRISEFSFTKRVLKYNNVSTLRIQQVNNQVQVVEEPHGHLLPYSFVIFLNDDFEGGELVFDNITVKPRKKQLVYFTGDETHCINTVVSGDRYTLVAFLTSDIPIYESKLI